MRLVAAAVIGEAGVVVSQNAKDLPDRLMPDGIQVVSAARFAADAMSADPAFARRALATMSLRYINPHRDVGDLLDLLRSRYGMDEAVDIMVPVHENEGFEARVLLLVFGDLQAGVERLVREPPVPVIGVGVGVVRVGEHTQGIVEERPASGVVLVVLGKALVHVCEAHSDAILMSLERGGGRWCRRSARPGACHSRLRGVPGSR